MIINIQIAHTDVVFDGGGEEEFRSQLIIGKGKRRKFEIATALTGAGHEGVTLHFILLTYPVNEVSNYT